VPAGDKWSVEMSVRKPDGTSTWQSFPSPTGLPQTDVWTHLAVTVDSVNRVAKLYVDGTLQATLTATYAYNNGATGMYVGDQYGSNRWTGSISDVQAYQKALSAAEVAQVKAGTAPAAGAGVIRTSWSLDESGLAKSERDPRGHTTDYGLDEAGRVAVVTQPAVLTEFDGGAQLLTRPVSYTGYDTFGAVVFATRPSWS